MEKNGVGVVGIDGDSGGGVIQAAANGGAVTFVSLAAYQDSAGAPVGSQYLARRTPAEWITKSITTPLKAQSYPVIGRGTPYEAFSSDLSTGLVLNPGENPVLTPSAPEGYENFYLRTESELRPLLTAEPKESGGSFHIELEGATDDLKHVVFESNAALTSNAVPGDTNMYEWGEGQLELINVLPGGTPDPTEPLWLGNEGSGESSAISEDGRRVVWSDGKELFMREDIGTPQVRTVQVDASRGGSDPSGGGEFLGASADGSRIFFVDTRRLTKEATSIGVPPGSLYEFRPETEELRDLTVDDADPGGAEVLGILGVGRAGDYVYFVANGVLASGATLGNCSSSFRSEAGSRCGLYVLHDGTTKYIGQLSGDDNPQAEKYTLGSAADWAFTRGVRTTRVSSDGQVVVFMSDADLTGYDSTRRDGESCGLTSEEEPTVKCDEVYEYDAETSTLISVSCNPDGERPLGPSYIPGGTDYRNETAIYQSRALSEDGSRVFFTSSDALVPQDVNGQEDVYEYENGRVSLISSGTGESDARFVDASADGSNAFFITEQQLVGRDRDHLADVYDAREGGGLEELPVVAPCVAEAGCRGPVASAPVFGVPPTNVVSGSGNLTPTSAPPVKGKPKPHKAKKKKAKRRTRRRVAKGRRRSRGRSGRASGKGR